jgi:recombination protein RecA
LAKLNWLTGRRPEPYYLTSPSFGIQRALGGQGFTSGRFHLYWGVKASGKTTFALQQIAAAQREGKICAFIDSEKAFSEPWAVKNGVDVDALLYIDSTKAEKTLELLLPDIESGKIDVTVVDSLNSLNFESFFDADKNPIGSYARSSKMVTHKILGALNHNQHVIFISHAAMDLSGYHPQLKAAVGNAVDHWASTIIKFQKVNSKNEVRTDGSFPVKWKIEKSKQSVYPVEGQYYFNSNTAEIDYVDELVTAAVEDGLVAKGGAWLWYPDKETCGENKWNGRDKFAEELRGNLTLQEEIADKLNAIGVKPMEEVDA